MFKLIKLLLVIVVIAVAGVMFLPLGSVEYTDPNLTAPLVVPSFSMFEGEDGAYAAKFQSVRSSWALEQEMDKILAERYIAHECADDTKVYFDQKNYITIYGYTIEQGFPFSEYTIEYGRANSCK